ncbi:hypothetical protein GW17_00030638 [Ensete ventricosum]|nr:hypothetical protein GW17_00030638 [Ensete ventricosum]RZR89012.1 hypothetical protein BHM03_00016670 [Ensete ventricosum]
MGLITHNRIYVCIGASLCPMIVDLVIIAGYWRPPLAGALWAASCGLATNGRPNCQRHARTRGWPPLSGGRQPPCKGALATTGRPCRVVGRGQPPPCRGLGSSQLPLSDSHGQPLLLAVLVANALNDSTRFNLITHNLKPIFRMKTLALIPLLETYSREIVYPYIPDPDGEDEGGQASSSLAVSTRWISTAKLLQSDLATLAQREGGE